MWHSFGITGKRKTGLRCNDSRKPADEFRMMTASRPSKMRKCIGVTHPPFVAQNRLQMKLYQICGYFTNDFKISILHYFLLSSSIFCIPFLNGGKSSTTVFHIASASMSGYSCMRKSRMAAAGCHASEGMSCAHLREFALPLLR